MTKGSAGADDVPEELTTKQAAAYLTARTPGYGVSPKLLYGMRATGRGPVVEKRGSRLVFRRSALDAFLSENGPNPFRWIEGWSIDVKAQLRAALGYDDPQLAALVDALDKRDPDDWDPDELTKRKG